MKNKLKQIIFIIIGIASVAGISIYFATRNSYKDNNNDNDNNVIDNGEVIEEDQTGDVGTCSKIVPPPDNGCLYTGCSDTNKSQCESHTGGGKACCTWTQPSTQNITVTLSWTTRYLLASDSVPSLSVTSAKYGFNDIIGNATITWSGDCSGSGTTATVDSPARGSGGHGPGKTCTVTVSYNGATGTASATAYRYCSDWGSGSTGTFRVSGASSRNALASSEGCNAYESYDPSKAGYRYAWNRCCGSPPQSSPDCYCIATNPYPECDDPNNFMTDLCPCEVNYHEGDNNWVEKPASYCKIHTDEVNCYCTDSSQTNCETKAQSQASGLYGPVDMSKCQTLANYDLTVNHYEYGSQTVKVCATVGPTTKTEGDSYTTSACEAPTLSSDYVVARDANNNPITDGDEPSGTMDGNKTVNYYYKRYYNLTVYHYIDGTNQVAPTNCAKVGPTRMAQGEGYSTVACPTLADGWEFSRNGGDPTVGEISKDTQVLYYYKPKPASLLVHHYEWNGLTNSPTTTSVCTDEETRDLHFFDQYETNECRPPIEYEIYKVPDNKNGTIEHEQEVVTYYYIKKAKLIVNHYEWDGINNTATTRSLCDTTTENHVYGYHYGTEACTTIPEGYELVSIPTNATGTLQNPETVVNYYYNRKGTLTVYHLEWDGFNDIVTETSVCPTTTAQYSFGQSYSTSRCTPPSEYRYLRVETDPEKADPSNGVISKFETVVKYYYIRKGNLIVHHYLWDLNNNVGTTNSLYNDQTSNNLDYGTQYTTNPHNLTGTNYSLYRTDGDPVNGRINKPTTEVIYYYAPLANLTVHHYKKNTTTKLCPDLTSTMNYFDNYSTEVCQSILDNYKFDSVTSTDSHSTISNQIVTGAINQASTVITYFYYLKPAKVIVHHYKWDVENDAPTTNKLCEDVITNGKYTDHYQSTKCNNLNDNSYKYMKVESSNPTSIISDDNVSGTIDKDEIVITYYYDYKPAKVTVHHYIKNSTTRVHSDQVTFTTYNVPYETNYFATDQLGDLYRSWYEYINVHTGDPVSGTVNKDEMVVNYYYDKMPAVLTVHHYIKGTTTKLHEDEVNNTLRFHDTYTTSHKQPNELTNPNYHYESVSGDDPNGMVNKPSIEVTYYYNARPAKLIVHHYKEGTTESVCEDVIEENKIYGDHYETHACENLPDTHNEFKRVISDDPHSVFNTTVVTGSFDQDVVVVTYYYGLKPAKVITHHYEKGTTTKVHDDDIDTNKKHLDPYTTHTYASSELNNDHRNWYYYIEEMAGDQPNGVIEKDVVEVIYYYDKKPATLTVHHYIDGTTTKLADDEVDNNYKYHDSYETHYKESSALTDTDYIYKSAAGDPVSGTINKDNVEVIYYYALKPANVIVHHYIDGTTTKLCNDVTTSKHYKDEYSSDKCTSLNDNAYKFKSVISDDDNSTIDGSHVTGTVKQDTIVITYYYDLKPAEIKVHHYIEGTTTKLCEDEHQDKLYKDSYTTHACADLSDNDYKYKNVITDDPNSRFNGSEVTGTVNQDVVEVIYYYELKPAKVIVHHYIDGTTTKLCDDESYMHKFKDNYDINLCTHLSDDAYKFKTVNSTDIDSNIEGSKVTGVVKNNFEVTYYYDLKSSEIIVHHVELDTHIKLAEDVHYSGLVYDTVKISEVDIEGYRLVQKPENENITFTVEPQEFTYYYVKIKYNITTEVLEGEGEITGDEIVPHGDDSTPEYIVITPDEDWEISKVIIDGVELEEIDPEGMVIDNFKHVTDHHKVQVIFTEKPIPVPITGRVSKLVIVSVLILMAGAFIFFIKPFKKMN